MEVATVLGAAASSSALGVIVGGLSSLGGRVMGIFETREARKNLVLQNEQETRRWAHELVLQEQASRERREETEDELKLRSAALEASAQELSFEGLMATIQNQTALVGKSYRWVDAVVALMRPVLTLLLWVALFVIAMMERGHGQATVETIVQTTCFGAATALAWWFGDRMAAKSAPGK